MKYARALSGFATSICSGPLPFSKIVKEDRRSDSALLYFFDRNKSLLASFAHYQRWDDLVFALFRRLREIVARATRPLRVYPRPCKPLSTKGKQFQYRDGLFQVNFRESSIHAETVAQPQHSYLTLNKHLPDSKELLQLMRDLILSLFHG